MPARNILVINCGSSSLKFALVNESQDTFPLQGLAERLGSPEAVVQWQIGDTKETRQIPNGAHREALEAILPLAQEVAGGQLDGIFAPVFFLYAGVAVLAVAGDARTWREGPPRGPRRLARHLWRMCFAMFNATGSFFLIASRVPEPIRNAQLRVTLAFLPLVLLFYWLWRVRRRSGRVLASAEPGPIRTR